MVTYVYETIPEREGEQTKQYEIRQSIRDKALTQHPETGEPIRRILAGAFGIMTGSASDAGPECCGDCENGPSRNWGGCGHGGGCCCAH
jgi:hypothetical protein